MWRRAKKTMIKIGIAVLLLVLFISSAVSLAVAQRRKTTVDLIIRGGTVVTMDGSRRVIDNGGVAINDGRIVAVGTAAEMDLNYGGRQVSAARGKGCTSGLINWTTHMSL